MSEKLNIKVYGIPNCQSVKKARSWLQERDLEYEFHDFKKLGVPLSAVKLWVKTFGWEVVLNKKGTTWRKMPLNEQSMVQDAQSAIAAMSSHPSLIKRPVMEINATHLVIGVNQAEWESVIQ